MLTPDTVVIITARIPAFLMQDIFSRVQSKLPGLRNQSWVSRRPSRESWYFSQPHSFSRRHTSSSRWKGLPRMVKGILFSFISPSRSQKLGCRMGSPPVR